METNTQQLRKFRLFGDYRKATLGNEDTWQYYNPDTGRQIKHLEGRKKVILYSKNTRLGYHAMAYLEKVGNDVKVLNEVFDQEGNAAFNDMWFLVKEEVLKNV